MASPQNGFCDGLALPVAENGTDALSRARPIPLTPHMQPPAASRRATLPGTLPSRSMSIMLSHSNCQWATCLIVYEVFLATFLTHDHVEPTQQHECGAVCLSDSRHRASLTQLHRRNRRGPITIRQWCSAVTLCSAPRVQAGVLRQGPAESSR